MKVSVLGFGAAPVAYLESDQLRAIKVIEQLLAAGVNLIDTAASYPGSEEFLGQHFSRRRNDFILVSKCGQTIDEVDSPAWSARTVSATVDRALKRLRTDHLDVMLLHSCKLDDLKKGDALGALVKAREAGKTRFIGYSGDNESLEFAAGLEEVDVIETSVSFADQINIDRGISLARKNKIGLIAKRPIANAAWKNISDQPGMYQDYAKEYTDRVRAMKISPGSVGYESKSGATEHWPEMALRFTLSVPGVHTAIIGTTSPQNAAANIRYASAGSIDAEVFHKIRETFAATDPDHKWTAQT